MQLSRRNMMVGSTAFAMAACKASAIDSAATRTPLEGALIERDSPRLDDVIDSAASISLLADGFSWSEGPMWDHRRARLLFCDIPNNRIHSWTGTTGLETFLEPAGASHGDVDPFAAPGTNGLFYENTSDSMLICNQDGRSIDRMHLESGDRTALVQRYEGNKFNSPNDVIRASNGTIYFTDPPYGLHDGAASQGRELDRQGVYALASDGTLTQVVRDMTLPNGVALSPDESVLYVSQSDPDAAILRRFTIEPDGSLAGGETWIDVTSEVGEANPGLPDGMAVDKNGNVWATGPGGVIILSPEGERLGRIFTGKATANCAFGEDGSTLYMTANDTLLSVPTKATGVFF